MQKEQRENSYDGCGNASTSKEFGDVFTDVIKRTNLTVAEDVSMLKQRSYAHSLLLKKRLV